MLDPNIPLAARAPEFQTPLESRIERTKGQDLLLQHQERVRSLQTQAKLRQILQQTGGDLEAALPQIMQLDPETGLTVQTKLAESKATGLKYQSLKLQHAKDEADFMGQLAGGIESPDDYAHMLYTAKTAGIDVSQFPQQYSPEVVKGFTEKAKTAKQRADEALKAVDDAREAEKAKETARHNQAMEDRQHDEALARIANLKTDNERQAAAQKETERHNHEMERIGGIRAANTGAAAQQTDPGAIADAIISGDQPPTLQGLYRLGAPVRSALAKKGFNLARAETDWKATQKHIATLNGAQQTRMAQAIDNAAHSLDVIDNLAAQWDAGKFPLLNKARLVAAKQGGLGPQAQKIAQALEAQISDVTSELGNVYMGGNSPTDHALGLAAKNLSADWSKDTLQTMVNLARTNLKIRANSMKNVGVAGASESNPYAPKDTGAVEEWVRDKNGKLVKKGAQ